MDFTKKPGGFIYIYIYLESRKRNIFWSSWGKMGLWLSKYIYIYILPIAKLIYSPVFVGIHRIGWTAGASPGSLSPTKHVCFVNSPIKNAKRLYVVINRFLTAQQNLSKLESHQQLRGTLWELNSLLCKNYPFMAGSINQ